MSINSVYTWDTPKQTHPAEKELLFPSGAGLTLARILEDFWAGMTALWAEKQRAGYEVSVTSVSRYKATMQGVL